MDDLGEGTIYTDLRELLDHLDACLSELRGKIEDLTIARGISSDDE